MSYSLSDLSAATFFYVGKPLLFAILVFFATFIYFICSSRSRSDDNKEAKSSSQASTLHEAEDDNGRPSNRVSVGLSRPTKHDGSSHGWIQDARKIYRKFLGKRRDRLGVDPDDASNNNSNHCRAPLRRRHSVSSSLQLARVAKDFFIRGRGTFLRPRPKTEVHRASLPRPPTEFFEPSENPSLPPHLKPEVFYILQNLKLVYVLPVSMLAYCIPIMVAKLSLDTLFLYVVIEENCLTSKFYIRSSSLAMRTVWCRFYRIVLRPISASHFLICFVC
ncbi:hypothetical protein AB6A40_007393 [Gnathostoma spinigerum]|uniref:Transmembrane protein n=1 Tax=Gnathostoma spinigerum TaxID=75299 RepID=A0ABD6EL40_9BILA